MSRQNSDTKYTLVCHSGWGYGGNPQFRLAVESRMIEGREIEKVKNVGGLVFDTYDKADKAEQRENYPPGVDGLIPCVRGSFSKKKVDGLAIYLPDSKRGLVLKGGSR